MGLGRARGDNTEATSMEIDEERKFLIWVGESREVDASRDVSFWVDDDVFGCNAGSGIGACWESVRAVKALNLSVFVDSD